MIDPLSLAVGAALPVGGWLVGHLTGRRAERRRVQRPQEPICGCGHHLALHDRQAGACTAGVARQVWATNGDRCGKEWVRCSCRQYVGPEPISSLWTPPAAIEGSDR